MPHVELPQAEFKVVLLGDTNTGKTSLVLRFVEGYYREAGRSSTVGAFFLTKRLTVQQMTCKLLLWDTAGQEQFQKLAITYYQHAAAAILCYDVTSPRSLVRLRKWLEELQTNLGKIVVTIAACKCDLDPAPGLQEEAERVANSVGALYISTSAKNNHGVTEVFSRTAEQVLKWQKDAAAGHAPSIPVTFGVGSVSRSRLRNRSMSPPNSNQTGNHHRHHHQHSKSAPHSQTSSPLLLLQRNSPVRKQSSSDPPEAASSSSAKCNKNDDKNEGEDSATVEESDDNVSVSVSKKSHNVMCEGLLACGSDDPGRSCIIL